MNGGRVISGSAADSSGSRAWVAAICTANRTCPRPSASVRGRCLRSLGSAVWWLIKAARQTADGAAKPPSAQALDEGDKLGLRRS
jgi:hypothetical protein